MVEIFDHVLILQYYDKYKYHDIFFLKNFKYESSVNIYGETKALLILVYKSTDKMISISNLTPKIS